VLEDRASRRIFGFTLVEVTREWRRLHNEELYNLYSVSDIIWVIKSRMRLVRHVAPIEERRSVYRLLVGTSEGKRPHGRPRHRWEDIIEMDIQEVGWAMDGIELAQDRDRWRALVNAIMNPRVACGNFWTS
jgi:hypothetical protein